MASSCNVIPTLTTTQVQTTDSTQTIITSSVSVVQPTTTVVTISTSTICPTFTRTASNGPTPSCSESPVVSSSVIPGDTDIGCTSDDRRCKHAIWHHVRRSNLRRRHYSGDTHNVLHNFHTSASEHEYPNIDVDCI
ncbi:hypothetical protein M378DRAFT_859713 [Amanita muscaria Koide BX008]|uniref:Uncharacterized protein n=1 Tax=Amanita muscaria (strain Koide BX008) TaxID=946122 RepID=A0A0C2WIC9_AMAMK|nr:hypothetical protein M378DRAFT_859713 [Amanita muscaria Koide BX008]